MKEEASDQIKEAVSLDDYFSKFRSNIVGIDKRFKTPWGEQPLVYGDWIASGRLYRPIEEIITDKFGPHVGNTHSESSHTGNCMTKSYNLAHQIIKEHVNARQDDVIITTGSGMTGVLAKFQRILGLRVPESINKHLSIPLEDKPVVFLTHMEHHSNHTPWLESLAEVVIIEPDDNLMAKPENLEKIIENYKNRKLLIGSISAGKAFRWLSNRHGGFCFVFQESENRFPTQGISNYCK